MNKTPNYPESSKNTYLLRFRDDSSAWIHGDSPAHAVEQWLANRPADAVDLSGAVVLTLDGATKIEPTSRWNIVPL